LIASQLPYGGNVVTYFIFVIFGVNDDAVRPLTLNSNFKTKSIMLLVVKTIPKVPFVKLLIGSI